MGCETWREAISARLDGEPAGQEDADLDAHLDEHLAQCPDCAAYELRLQRLHRSFRIAPATPVPDLTATILAAAAAARRPGLLPRALPWNGRLVLRWILVVLAAFEIGMAAPEMSGRWHAGGELGTWAIASAVGLLSVAAKPSRAGAVLPMLACASVITVFVSLRDVVEGEAMLSAEWPHLLLVCGVFVLVALWQAERSDPGPDVRVSSDPVSHRGTLRERVRRTARRAA